MLDTDKYLFLGSQMVDFLKKTDASSQLQDMHAKNMSFLEKNVKEIYTRLINRPKRDKLNIVSTTGELDLILEDGYSVYKEKAISNSIAEVEEFKKIYSEGKTINSVSTAMPNTYKTPRTFARLADNLTKLNPELKNPGKYKLRKHYPMIVFMGTGLALHIDYFLQTADVNHVVIVEPNIDHLWNSLYLVDWEIIFSAFKPLHGKSIRLIVPGSESEDDIFATTWNSITLYTPIFPCGVIFYNHLKRTSYGNVIRRLNKDLHVYLNVWGNYDDEVNQMNNALHNLRAEIKTLNNTTPLNNSAEKMPVFIIGAGPSLNEQIENIKTFNDKIFIISCGTALKSLHKHNIKPDIHVEIESDYTTLFALDAIKDDNYISNIPLIGPIQLSPLVFDRFKEKRLFYKDSTALTALFAKKEDVISGTTPTCTNTGLSIATQLGFDEIYLLGMDFGFSNEQDHHADGSIYFDKETMSKFGSNNFESAPRFKVKAAKGGLITTHSIYYTAKRRLEEKLHDLKINIQNIKIFNLSNGASIDHSNWVPFDQSASIFNNLNNTIDKSEIKDIIFSDNDEYFDVNKIDDQLKRVTTLLNEIFSISKGIINKTDNSLNSLEKGCFIISNYLENTIQKRYGLMYFLVRGSIWHLLYTGYSIALSQQKIKNEKIFIKNWKKEFCKSLDTLEIHFKETIIERNYTNNNDPWLKKSISDPEN